MPFSASFDASKFNENSQNLAFNYEVVCHTIAAYPQYSKRMQPSNRKRRASTDSDLPAVDLQQLIDGMPAFVQTADPNGNMLFLNKEWLEYAGLTMDEARGMHWTSVIHPDDLKGVVDDWVGHVKSGEATYHRSRVRRHDGEFRWFLHRIVPIRNDAGEIVRWCGASVDIHELVEAEAQVRRDREEMRQIIDLVPQQIFVLDTEGRTVYWNKVAIEYIGLPLEECLADDIQRRVFHPEDADDVLRDREAKLKIGAPFETEVRVRRADGEYRWMLVRLNPLRDEDGHILHWYGSRTDIHDRKTAEEAILNENIALREEIDKVSMFEEIVGSSRPIRSVLGRVEKVARTDSTVLLLGETGTGKELIARAIHKRSPRANRAFISVNCAAIPQALIGSELFGHEKGSFTGATQRRIGRFELADKGTIFLDEVGDLPPETQVALLRVLQEREIERVGGSRPIKIDVRVIAATNRDLEAAIAAGEFRSDLFYRLNVFPIEIPPLRERRDDIPPLVEYFIDRFSRQSGRRMRAPDSSTLNLLRGYSWPGNVRELQNVVERSLIVGDGDGFRVDESWLRSRSQDPHPAGSGLGDTLVAHEKKMIENALESSRGRVAGPGGAAASLGLPVSTLESRIKSLKIDKYRFKSLR